MRCSPNRQQRGLLSGGGSAFYLSLSKDHLLVPTLRQRGLHGDNLVASGLQFSAAIIALYILRMPGNSICQTIEGKVTARNKMSQNALALADVELLGRKLNYLGSCRRENGSFLGIPEFLHQRIEPGFIDRCPDGVLNLHQECPVFSFDGLIPENPEITIHAFVDAANVAFANAHIRHHAIGADKPVNQRLHGHAAHADLRIGNQDAGLNNVPRHYLGLDALVDNLDVHTGIELFRAVEQALGKREIIAEDLGYMSETVRQLVQDSGFPGMKVLEFAFDSRDTGSASDYLPHNYPVNSVAYTGTHDNETLVSWYQTITSAERTLVRDYLYDYTTPEPQLYKSMIALIFRSAAATCIIPMQDWLGLDNSARINKPSTVGENWRWRLKKSQLTPKLQKEICSITTRYGRMNWA